jgi:hypothetical protein
MTGENDRPLPIHALVMGVYGATMFQVQVWEFNLAALTNVALANATPAASPAAAQRRNKKSFDRIVHLTQKATAQWMRGKLENAPNKVQPAVIEEIAGLLKLRDRLAHRYLREELIDPHANFGLNAKIDHALELQGFSARFQSCCGTVQAETQRLLAELGPEPLPEDVKPLIMATFAPLLFSQARQVEATQDGQ